MLSTYKYTFRIFGHQGIFEISIVKNRYFLSIKYNVVVANVKLTKYYCCLI